MKILYVLNSNSTTGGATKSFMAMLQQVLQRGHSVLVVCPSTDGIYKDLNKIDGVKVVCIKYRSANYPLNRNFMDKVKWLPRLVYTLLCNHRAVMKLTRLVNLWKPDLIHENTSVTDVGYKVAKKLNIPCVTHIREYGDKDFGLNLYNVASRLRHPDVYAIPITKDIAKHRGVLENDRSFQIYNGIIREEEIRYSPEKSKYFLFAGRIEAPKGIEDLLDAYSIYCNNTLVPFILKVAGDAYDKEYLYRLKQKAERLNISKHIEWLGPQRDIADLYYGASATIIPSWFEGLGRVMPEAMANGCLCIGRDTGGTKEQLDEGKKVTGQEIGFRFREVEELGNLLISISEVITTGHPFEPDGRFHNIIAASQKAIKSNFTVNAFGEKLMNAYKKILKR